MQRHDTAHAEAEHGRSDGEDHIAICAEHADLSEELTADRGKQSEARIQTIDEPSEGHLAQHSCASAEGKDRGRFDQTETQVRHARDHVREGRAHDTEQKPDREVEDPEITIAHQLAHRQRAMG